MTSITKNQQIQNPVQVFSLDVAKFVLALLVIAIHTRPFANTSDLADFILSDFIARMAVPVFFAASGYLFFSKQRFSNGKIDNCPENRTRLFRYLKKIVFLYIAWSLIYFLFSLPEFFKSGWWGIPMIKDFLFSFFFQGSHYHLWYLLATIYAVPVLYLLLSVFSWRKLCYLIPLLWIFECLVYSYDWLGISQISWLVWLMDHFPIVFDSLFRAVPLLFVGLLCYQYSDKEYKYRIPATAISIVVCFFEATLLYFFSPNESQYSYLLTTPTMAFFLLTYVLSIEYNGSAKLGSFFRKSSLVIYCFHPLVLETLVQLGISSNSLLWLLTTVLTLMFTSLWLYGKHFLYYSRHAKRR